MKIGYARVSTDDQSLDVQREQLAAAGCERIHAETASGKSLDGRPVLKTLMDFLHDGDVLVVTKLDRLSRSTVDMLQIIADIGKNGAKFTSIAEPWCDTTSAAGELMLTVFAGVAQFERARIRERQREGIAKAKEGGKFKGGKARFDAETIRQKKAAGMRPVDIARELGCSDDTVARALKANGAYQ